MTLGSIVNREDTGIYNRDFEANFVEIKIEKEVLNNLLVELGYESFQGDDFLKAASAYQIEGVAEGSLKLLSEVLYDTENSAVKMSAGFSVDILELLTENSSGVTFEFRHAYMSKDMGERGYNYTTRASSPLNEQRGEYSIFRLNGKLSSDKESYLGKATWFADFRHEYVTSSSEFQFGIVLPF